MNKLFLLIFSTSCFIPDTFANVRNPFATFHLPECHFKLQWRIVGIVKTDQQTLAFLEQIETKKILSISNTHYLPDTIWQVKQINNQQIVLQRDTRQGCPEGQEVISVSEG